MKMKDIRIIRCLLSGGLTAWGFLLYPDSILVLLSFVIKLPGIVWLLCLSLLLVFGMMVRFRMKWYRLASGDITNFAPSMKAWLSGQTAYFTGIGIFCATHWVIYKQGYGLATAISVMVLAFMTWWFSSQLSYFMILNNRMRTEFAK